MTHLYSLNPQEFYTRQGKVSSGEDCDFILLWAVFILQQNDL